MWVIIYPFSIRIMSESTKKCPFCESEVSETAVKCKYCWEFIDKRYKKTDKLIYRDAFQISDPKIFCPQCWYEGKTSKIERKGNSSVWCLLFLFFFIPGMIYNARRGRPYFVCPECGYKHIKKLEKK